MIEFLRRKIKSLFAGRSKSKSITESAVTFNHHRKHKHSVTPTKPHTSSYPVSSNIPANKTGTRRPNQIKPVAVIKQKLPVFNVKPKLTPDKPDSLLEVPPAGGKSRFVELPIHRDVLFGIQQLDFKYCTPIQEKALPILLSGGDLTGKAQTGTGKTAAFLIAAFTRLLNSPQHTRLPGHCRALVLAPTRELAIQIHKDAEALGIFTGLNNVVVFGGMDHGKQRDMLGKPVDVLIGTPGRIIDYSRSCHLNLSKTEVLIIDEADRMLDMGFIPDVSRIVRQLPVAGVRQTMFFSATLDPAILRLVNNWLKNPATVESESEQMVTDLIEQVFYSVAQQDKFALLLWLLRHEQYQRILIFGNRKDHNSSLERKLIKNKIKCAMLSGDVPQTKRIKILERFRSGEERILIATDVAARGIHVDDVSIVINYDIPERPEDYVHRIGRTGRAGQKGKSIGFVCEYGAYTIGDIEKYVGAPIKCILPDDEMLDGAR